MQQFLADSPWDSARVVQAVAERVAPVIGVEAWVVDDTGFPKDGKDSPGVKLPVLGHAREGRELSDRGVGARGRERRHGAVGWTLYLPEGCADAQRRRKAKIPDAVAFRTKVELAGELVERASGWAVPRAPVLGDHDYGRRGKLRARLDQAGCEYVLAVGGVSQGLCKAGANGASCLQHNKRRSRSSELALICTAPAASRQASRRRPL